ncbi:MAG: multidrug ABC transporter ATP-binding protein [Rhodospirillaceae bacterium TMED8]|nr:multidrug ABC transporter ATP-binding protein [Magnetovibrio sp.]OUT47813.1 MAG: multidrug ABC transporter ATP-binding protein [Rhodospirillaceae bacterium TMED8]|tara:strand:+ start:233 stop:1159 length:927 start_codon:yes stop_codon:yes gene_type:complete
MEQFVSVSNLTKTYASGFQALNNVSLDVREGEILALLGPNGAGKTTLISIICGIVNATSGTVTVAGYDNVKDYKKTRALIGLVPQELTTDSFETVSATVNFSRGLFGKPPNTHVINKVLKSLTLWDKRDSMIMALSGGMKRRVLIAKALSHEPRVLFLDEPTAGVDVELRREMWKVVEELRTEGVTVILTTHYIEEAEAIADRVAVINHGEIILVEEKSEMMRKMGKKRLEFELVSTLNEVPHTLDAYDLSLSTDGLRLTYTYDTNAERKGITALMGDLSATGIRYRDMETQESSLEEIFVNLVREPR